MKDNRPKYYAIELPDGYALEVRLLIDALGYGEGFYRGAALKHLCRAGRKPGQPAIEDLVKCQTYLSFEIDRLIREASTNPDDPDQVCLDKAFQRVAGQISRETHGRITSATAVGYLRRRVAGVDPAEALEALESFDSSDAIEAAAELLDAEAADD